MADAVPLFVPTLAELKTLLRFDTAIRAGALEILNNCVRKSRVEFVSKLGSNRVVQIQAFTYTEQSTSIDSLTKMRAVSCEVSLVKFYMMQDLPTIFIDASGVAQELFNTEPFRKPGEAQYAQELRRLETSITTDMEFLAGLPQPSSTVTASILGPGVQNTFPGSSIWPK